MKNLFISVVLLCSFGMIYAQWTPDPFCPYPSDHVTRYRYYGNCSIYWECYQGAKYTMECPEGLEFNELLQQCDAPEIADCDPLASTTGSGDNTETTMVETTTDPMVDTITESTSTESTPGTTTTSKTTTDSYPPCPNNNKLVYFPCIGDCTKYWECFAGNSYLYVCSPGLWWHQEISECDYPGAFCDNVSTWTPTTLTTTTWSMGPTPTELTTATSGNDPRCSQGGTSYWPNPGECYTYVKCINNRVKDCVRVDESECCQEYECVLS